MEAWVLQAHLSISFPVQAKSQNLQQRKGTYKKPTSAVALPRLLIL